MPDQEQLQPLTFPLSGINLIREFELQIPATTPIALNVRGYEPETARDRGGSRPGLTKWIPAFVNGSSPALIQCLDVLVTCAGTALLTDFGLDLFGPTIPDPNNPQFDVPQFGSGVQLNKNFGSTAQKSNVWNGALIKSGSGQNYAVQLLPPISGSSSTAKSLSTPSVPIPDGNWFLTVNIGGTNFFEAPYYT